MIVEFPNDNNKDIDTTNKLDEESCNEYERRQRMTNSEKKVISLIDYIDGYFNNVLGIKTEGFYECKNIQERMIEDMLEREGK